MTYIVGSGQPGLLVPDAVGYLVAAAFFAAAVVLLLQARGAPERMQRLPALLIVLTMTGVGGWIAFGPGDRQCVATLGVLPFLSNALVCRGAFGAGTLLTALVAIVMIRPRKPASG